LSGCCGADGTRLSSYRSAAMTTVREQCGSEASVMRNERASGTQAVHPQKMLQATRCRSSAAQSYGCHGRHLQWTRSRGNPRYPAAAPTCFLRSRPAVGSPLGVARAVAPADGLGEWEAPGHSLPTLLEISPPPVCLQGAATSSTGTMSRPTRSASTTWGTRSRR
jgi:hypothetical protein